MHRRPGKLTNSERKTARKKLDTEAMETMIIVANGAIQELERSRCDDCCLNLHALMGYCVFLLPIIPNQQSPFCDAAILADVYLRSQLYGLVCLSAAPYCCRVQQKKKKLCELQYVKSKLEEEIQSNSFKKNE